MKHINTYIRNQGHRNDNGEGEPTDEKGNDYHTQANLAEKWRAPEALPWEYQGLYFSIAYK